jgi:hypothetical protein
MTPPVGGLPACRVPVKNSRNRRPRQSRLFRKCSLRGVGNCWLWPFV